ncbi:MAG: fibronectin type III domain-containing protein [Clostridia bacterium]|nr:fibronectin type III domain-containing protein [Clostridia bacterium]
MSRKPGTRLIALLLVMMFIIPAAALCVYADEETETEAVPAELPESFDLRDVDGKSYVTPVRSQAPFGTCWSFATIAAIESSILGAGLNGADGKPAAPETLDLSEKQMAWFSAMPVRDEKNSQNGEGQFIADFFTEESLINFMNRGGNACFSTSALSQGIGPEHESTAPILEYHGKNSYVTHEWIGDGVKEYSYSIVDDWSIPDEYRNYSAYDLREARFLPEPFTRDENGEYKYSEEATQAIKNELLNKRAVQISFYADTNMPGQNSKAMFISENWAHYTYTLYPSNHCVTIIGWDDNYSKDNFLQGEADVMLNDGTIVSISRTPPADGAWLVKNSWGDANNDFPNRGAGTWGIEDENGAHTGYFWLSYYDHSLDSPVSYVIEEKDKDINIIQQYDYMPVPVAQYYTSEDKLSMANMFSAQHNQVIEQVSSFTPVPDVTVTYDIYLIDAFASSPDQGLRVATKTVNYEYGGFHKEDISDFDILFDTAGDGSNQIKLVMYQDYSVVVTQKTADGRYLINYQAAQFSQGGGITSFKGVRNEGESWVFHDDSWEDVIYAEDFSDTVFETLHPDEPFIKEEMTYDNFPIKVFAKQEEKDFGLEVGGNTYLYYKTEESGSSVMKVSVHAVKGTLPDIPADTVVWGLVDKDTDVVALESMPNPMRGRFTARDVDGKHTEAYVQLKGFGTVPFSVFVYKIVIKGIFLPQDENLDEIFVFKYTGDEIRPAEGVDVPSMVEEGVDFNYKYEDNVKCGVATITIDVIGDKVSSESWGTAKFVIVPEKSEIESVTPGSGQLTVRFRDQSECGLDGYTVEYRKQGEEEWQKKDFDSSSSECVVDGLEGETVYEVRVMGRVDLPEDIPFWYHDDLTYYGEASDITEAKTEKSGESPVQPDTSNTGDIDTVDTETLPESDSAKPDDTSTRANTPEEEGSKPSSLDPMIIVAIAGGALLLIIIVLVLIFTVRKKKIK